MFLALLSLILLIAMVVWVINLGEQVDRRENAQHTADAAAQAAGGWASRMINTISANNTDMARTLAVINVLDAFPQAVDYSTRETRDFSQALSDQLSRGINEPNGPLSAVVNGHFNALLQQLSSDLEELEPVNDLFASVDVREMTHYARDGYLWKSLIGADQVNQAIVESYGASVQASATHGALRNFHEYSDDSEVLLLPAEPQLPHRRGRFEDFRRPVVHGMLPVSQDDPVEARGPWDAVFGWRHIISQRIPGSGGGGGASRPGSRSVVRGGRGNSPLSRSARSNGGGGGGTSIPVAYRTFGPHDELLNMSSHQEEHRLLQSRLYHWLRPIADTKLNYLWPGSRRVRRVYEPDWRLGLDEAKAIDAAGVPRIRETVFFVLEIKSAVPQGGAGFLSPGTWSLAFDGGRSNPRVQRVGGFQNPEKWTGVNQLNNWVWKDNWEYQVYWDAAIGIQQQSDADGNPIAQTVYRYDYYIFGGVNVGPEATIENPYQGFNPTADDAPSPILLDGNLLPFDGVAARWDHMKFLAIVRQTDRPQAWGSRFSGGRPYPNLVTIAQSRVFNDHSWDYWTQMWKTELEPVSNRDGTVGIGDWAMLIGTSSAPSADDLQKYLMSLEPMAPFALGH